ncbi:MAG: hypothetical protein U0271_33505 [Polyangiaceae bacterium]
MTWQAILQTSKPIDLEQFEPVLIAPHIAKLSPNMYAIPLKEGAEDVPRDAKTRFVAWAVSDGAACRVLSNEIERDTPSAITTPPPELEQYGRTYAEIVDNAQALGKDYEEYTLYRVATDGKLVAKCIEIGKLVFYFRSAKSARHERPFAISIRLRE